LLTNHFNLTASLGSGVFKPREGYRKYYGDLSDLTPGALPLVFDTPDKNVIEYVTREKFSLPVAIELNPDRLPVLDSTDSKATLTIKGVLPVDAARRIVFRSEADLTEATARHYDGIDYTRVPMEVDPAVFESEAPSDFLKRLQGQGADGKAIRSDVFRLADRCAGAIALASSVLPEVRCDLSDVAFLFHAQVPERVVSSASILKRGWDNGAAHAERTSDTLFFAAMEVLREVDRLESWDPIKILKTIADRFNAKAANASPDVVDLLRKIWKVLRLEAPYALFTGVEPAEAANSILWVLAQPEPEAIASVPVGTKPSDELRLRVAILSGALNGYELLPSSLRSPSVDRFLAAYQADFINKMIGADFPNNVAKTELRTRGEAWELFLAGDRILHGRIREADVPSAQPRAQTNKTDDAAAIAECKRRGWYDCIRLTLRVPRTGSLTVQVLEDEAVISVSVNSVITEELNLAEYERRRKK
jgi:hypothetical protein